MTEEACKLPDILHDLRNIIQGDVHDKHLDLYMDAVGIRHEEIWCDRLRLNQVLLNLLSNAIKYTPVGGMVSLRIMEKAGAPAGFANYEFHVKDTGIGMSKEFISRIFEPFERERNSTVSGIQGTGLGMAITKNIVDIMNGTITVESRQGAGTECIVSLTLRLHNGEKALQDIPELKGVRALVEDDVLRTGRILLVEDNELNQEIATAILEEAGFTVEVAGNGQIAVDMLKASQPGYYQTILMDVQMPVMNGHDAARAIRALEGMDAHVAKPLDVELLKKAVAQCTKRES